MYLKFNFSRYSSRIILFLAVLVFVYVICYVSTCYRPSDGAKVKLENYFSENKIEIHSVIHLGTYIEPTALGECGVFAMASITSIDYVKPKYFTYKIYRSWFFGKWKIVDISEYGPHYN